MSYFNEDQEDYIEELSKRPNNKKCWCGWYRLDECYHCNQSHPHQTLEDRLKTEKKDD